MPSPFFCIARRGLGDRLGTVECMMHTKIRALCSRNGHCVYGARVNGGCVRMRIICALELSRAAIRNQYLIGIWKFLNWDTPDVHDSPYPFSLLE